MRVHHRRNWAGFATLVALVLTSICPTPLLAQTSKGAARRQAIALHRKGQSLLNEGKKDEAAQAFEEALKLAMRGFGRDDPNTANIMYMLAIVYVDRGSMQGAEPLLKQCVKVFEATKPGDPNLAVQRYLLGKVYHATNRLGEAEPLLQHIENAQGATQSLRLAKSQCHARAGERVPRADKYQDAEATFLRARS